MAVKLSQLTPKATGDSNDQIVLYSGDQGADVLISVGNLYANSLLTAQNAIVTGVLTVGNSTVNVVINSTTTFGGGGGGNGTPGGANTQIQFNQSNTFGGDANFTWNWTSEYLTVGNSTINTVTNSTNFSGIANSAKFIGTTSAANVVSNTQLQSNLVGYALLTGASFSGDVNVGSNVVMSFINIYVGNSVANTTINNTGFSALGGITSGNLTVNGSALFIGNSTVNSIVNSTVFSGTSNNVSFVGSTSAANVVSNTQLTQNLALYSLLTGASFSGDVNVGSNVVLTTTSVYVGNSTVNTLMTNSGLFTLGGIVSGNLTVNGSALFIGNSTVNALVNSTVFSGTSNNTSFVGTVSAANVVSNAQLVANLANYIAITGATFTGDMNVGANVVVSLSSVYVGNSTVNATHTNSGMSILGGVTSGNITLGSTSLFIGNSTVNALVNSTVFTGTANNSTNLGGTAAASYLTNTGTYTVSGLYKFIANVSVNGNFIANGGVGGSGQVLTSGGSGQNVYWSTVSGGDGGTNPAGSNNMIQFNESGSFGADANLQWNWASEYLTIGNSTVNTVINSTSRVTGNSTVNSIVNSTALSVSNVVIQNNLIKSSGAIIPTLGQIYAMQCGFAL